MVKIEIDLDKEINKIIEKEVEKRLDEGGILRFIRNVVKYEVKNSGTYLQLQRHEGILRDLKKKFAKDEVSE